MIFLSLKLYSQKATLVIQGTTGPNADIRVEEFNKIISSSKSSADGKFLLEFSFHTIVIVNGVSGFSMGQQTYTIFISKPLKCDGMISVTIPDQSSVKLNSKKYEVEGNIVISLLPKDPAKKESNNPLIDAYPFGKITWNNNKKSFVYSTFKSKNQQRDNPVIVPEKKYSIAQKIEPTEKDALLAVSVINEKNKPQAGEQVTFESSKTKKTFSGITKDNGKFDILVPKGDKYNVKYKAFTSDADYTVLEVPDKKGELISFEITVQFELPKQYTLDNVYFDFGKATLRQESYKELNELVEYMKLKKSLVIEIAGHTDNVGSADANLKLSQGRADAVRTYLIKKGITTGRVIAKGYGDTQPIASNDTEEGRQKNRRTEVRVIKE